MARTIVSSIVLFLILSVLEDGKVFAAHRKLSNGAMKRYLGEGGNKINAGHSKSLPAGKRTPDKDHSTTSPDNTMPPGQPLTYKIIRGTPTVVCNVRTNINCKGTATTRPCIAYNRCKRGTVGG